MLHHHFLTPLLLTIMPLAAALSLTTPKSNIVILGLNPALQKRFLLAPSTPLTPGNVHRSTKVETGVGGKGQDVAIALRCLAGSEDDASSILLAQFIGRGAEGDTVLNELERRSLSTALTVRNDAPLRTCTTIISSWDATELVENSGMIRPEEMEQLLHRVEEWTAGVEEDDAGKASAVCIMGSMPPGCAEDTYAQLTRRLVDDSSLVLIDSVVGLDPLLKTLNNIYGNDKMGGVGGGAVLKLNAAELCKLGNVAKKESECVTLEELKLSTCNFMSKYVNARALQYLCVTDGKFPGYLVEVPSKSNDEFRMWKMDSIDLSQRGTLFPIGAGDTVAAGTLAAWQYLHHGDVEYDGVITSVVGDKLVEKERKWSRDENEKGWRMAAAFAFGIACGSASCLKEENSVFDVEDALEFLEGMTEPVLLE